MVGNSIKNSIPFIRNTISVNELNKHLICAYTAKGKTNEDSDRDVIRDLSGNGLDLKLYNFAFSSMSGYGGYDTNWKDASIFNWVFGDSIKINYTNTVKNWILYGMSNKAGIPCHKIKVTKLENVSMVGYYYIDSYNPELQNNRKIIVLQEGEIYNLPQSIYVEEIASDANDNNVGIYYNGSIDESKPSHIIIEQVPNYPDTLCFDGIDNYAETIPFKLENPWTVVVDCNSKSRFKNAGIIKNASFFIYDNGLFINSANKYTNINIKNIEAFNSKKEIYSGGNKIVDISDSNITYYISKLYLSISYSLNSFSKLLFKNFAIYDKILTLAEIKKAKKWLNEQSN